jgi:hypothetical protein
MGRGQVMGVRQLFEGEKNNPVWLVVATLFGNIHMQNKICLSIVIIGAWLSLWSLSFQLR